ncbi:glutamate receptor ionotropic, kainate 2-like [Anopheles ziemanni]|uniref:glutamate receptor ionotropic, kainate 2-like n=1 Tax=Anopheles coustani TaxID=139045 RepID=UPI002657E21E|nr:glutamate receptor ionotropic, kainate 2-like [Anopheles coustani]XP_058176227.1 glutamate receptor ionotropic, kainate 2-like [Anopheles ziemanni]
MVVEVAGGHHRKVCHLPLRFFPLPLLLLLALLPARLLAYNGDLDETVEHIKIGGLFDSAQEDAELAFQYAVEAVNNEKLSYSNYQLEAQAVRVKYGDQFDVSKKLCRLLTKGVAGIFGPSSPKSALHVQSLCDEKEMPHIETRWDAYTKLPTLNLHPHPHIMGRVLLDLVVAFEWKDFTIMYESGPWLPSISDLLKMYDPKGYTVTVRQLDLKLNGNYRAVLRRVKLSEDKRIILACSIDSMPEVLRQAQQVGLLTDHHQIIVTSLDLHTIDLEPYQYSGTNITGIRLIDPEEEKIKQVTEFLNASQIAKKLSLTDGLNPAKMRVETALMYDAVLLYAEALKHLIGSDPAHLLEPLELKCDETTTWKNGYSIINYMKSSTIHGLTRSIKFDHQGHRSDFLLDIIELGPAGLEKVGVWNSTEGLNFTRKKEQTALAFDDGTLQNRTFLVLTAISPPYGMLKDSPVKLTGNERFEGFGIDLIHELSLMLGFNYTFILQEDGVYGSLNRDTKKWNGMVLELLEWRADLAITDLTITSDRESAVDFTMPFMNLGISILYRKPTKQPPSLFSFMSPFSKQVWLYLGGAYMMVSMSFFILGRISPKEWDNPYPCIEEPEELENQFSFSNSMWFTIGALLQQGSEIAPKAPATRAVASIWWFFTLIMVSSYTANLAAFLTIEQVSSPINNAEELAAAGGKVKYGAKRDGSTISFFKDAEYGTYAKMYKYMMDNVELLTSSNPEGLQRVKTENYAFLMESTSIEYIVERECDVTQIGGLLDDKGYGIAMRKNSPYRSALSEAVLRLQEQGVLTSLKRKWWKEKRGGGACSNTMEEGGALALELANVGGVFVLLIVGCVAALFVSFCEMLCDVHSRSRDLKQSTSDDGAEELGMDNVGGVFFVLFVGCSFASLFGCCELFFVIAHRARRHKVPFREELMAELRFVAKCHGNTKPVRHRKSSSGSGHNSIESAAMDSTGASAASSKQDISGGGEGAEGHQRKQNGTGNGKSALNGTRKVTLDD